MAFEIIICTDRVCEKDNGKQNLGSIGFHRVIERLEKHLGCECLMDDLIAHDEQGNYLRDWIVVQERVVQENDEGNDPTGTTAEFSDVPAGSFADVPAGTTTVPVNVPAGSIALASRWKKRQQWVIDEL